MLSRAEQILKDAIAANIGSAAALFVSHKGRIVHHAAYGQTQQGPKGRAIDTDAWFDLASLTKPLVVGTLCAIFLDRGLLDLDQPVCEFVPAFKGEGRETVTLRMLLQHRSGLPDWRPFYKRVADSEFPRDALLAAVCAEPLLHPVGEIIDYSDLGYILLGAALENIGGARLDTLFKQDVIDPLALKNIGFLPFETGAPGAGASDAPAQRVATENCPRRGLLIGQVHDDNAWAVGGVCGHAGLFGTAQAVGTLLDEWFQCLHGEGWLFSHATAIQFAYPLPSPPRADFALAWDRPTWKRSPAGRFISPDALGHWGYTGTSAWLDHDRDLSIVLLTNRVHPSHDEARIRELRLSLHESIYEELGLTAPGPFRKRPKPEDGQHIHLIAVAGTGMGSLAGMLKAAGYRVTGSDQAVYPPMSDILAAQGIEVRQPFGDANLADSPDLVVVGNVCSRDHEEVVCAKRRGLALDSMPGVLERYFLMDKKPLVVAGTHGKTTTSSMLAWLLAADKQDPGFMIGGLVRNFGANFRLGDGPFFVVEGDEYDSAYFDKYPKFLHYRPHAAIITSIEYDHADIYDSLDEIVTQFERLAALIPPDGLLAACWDYETVRDVSRHARCRVLRYGEHPEAEWRARVVSEQNGASTFDILNHEKTLARVTLPMSGAHNIANALATAALLIELGHDPAALDPAFRTFAGIARRQQVRGVVDGVTVIDDFAHHPTAVLTTLDGLRRAYPSGRLWVAFDPRTNTSSRNVFQQRFAEVFDSADGVWIGSPSRMDRIAPEQRMDPQRLAADISSRGPKAVFEPDIERMTGALLAKAQPGDTIAVLSNGSFGGLHEKLLAGLRERESSRRSG
jgi:UDP-N-acetylmuramate: L-alanyl-gamma-D-glutamyl-meso-diaminopimelate ligase